MERDVGLHHARRRTAPAPAPASYGTASGRPRIYDASEGTPLDPLRNKTYDLSYAKVVPADTMIK